MINTIPKALLDAAKSVLEIKEGWAANISSPQNNESYQSRYDTGMKLIKKDKSLDKYFTDTLVDSYIAKMSKYLKKISGSTLPNKLKSIQNVIRDERFIRDIPKLAEAQTKAEDVAGSQSDDVMMDEAHEEAAQDYMEERLAKAILDRMKANK